MIAERLKASAVAATINEHQEPLKFVWSWICDDRDRLTVEEIAFRFERWPMVTITCDEDQRLRDEARRARQEGRPVSCDPVERYRFANIEIGLCENGKWVPLTGAEPGGSREDPGR